MTTPDPQSSDRGSRWTAQTVGMSVDILDRMERAVAKVRGWQRDLPPRAVQGPLLRRWPACQTPWLQPRAAASGCQQWAIRGLRVGGSAPFRPLPLDANPHGR